MARMSSRVRKPLVSAVAFACLLGGSAALAGAPVVVTSGADDGAGSLREALASGSGVISIHPSVTIIAIDSPLVYDGEEPLRLTGFGQSIESSGSDFTLFEVSEGANVEINNLGFYGIGGFDLDNAGTGKGIYVKVPETRTGVVRLKLNNVEVMGVANHGVHVSDCTLGDACGSGSGGAGDGSPASVQVIANRLSIEDAGNGKFDADGLRVDERADGDIMAKITNSTFYGVGADGIELDEGNNGNVDVALNNVALEHNGGYCAAAPLVLAHPCIEDDDGDLVRDLDDGMDIDEAGAGGITGSVYLTYVDSNLDEGLDYDEEGPGGMSMTFWQVDAMNNGDEGLKMSAADGGPLYADLRAVDIRSNGDDGIQIENENGDGETHVVFANSRSKGNAKDGLKVTQENMVDLGTLQIRGFSDVDSVDTDNVDQI